MIIILDRDGVINYESPDYIKSPEEWIPIPGSLEAIAQLKELGCKVFVATNQAGIARGLYTEETLQSIHQKMQDALKQLGVNLDGIFYCPHDSAERCFCRKPKPGLLLTIKQQLPQENFDQAFFVGDSLRDIQAGEQAGIQPVLVLTGNGRETQVALGDNHIPTYADLAEFVASIIS